MNYQEKTQEGEIRSWRRAYRITFNAGLDFPPSVQFDEEDVNILPDGKRFISNNTSITHVFTNPDRIITAVNRETGEVVGQFPVGLLDCLITGLYLEEAAERDNPVVEVQIDAPVEITSDIQKDEEIPA